MRTLIVNFPSLIPSAHIYFQSQFRDPWKLSSVIATHLASDICGARGPRTTDSAAGANMQKIPLTLILHLKYICICKSAINANSNGDLAQCKVRVNVTETQTCHIYGKIFRTNTSRGEGKEGKNEIRVK